MEDVRDQSIQALGLGVAADDDGADGTFVVCVPATMPTIQARALDPRPRAAPAEVRPRAGSSPSRPVPRLRTQVVQRLVAQGLSSVGVVDPDTGALVRSLPAVRLSACLPVRRGTAAGPAPGRLHEHPRFLGRWGSWRRATSEGWR